MAENVRSFKKVVDVESGGSYSGSASESVEAPIYYGLNRQNARSLSTTGRACISMSVKRKPSATKQDLLQKLEQIEYICVRIALILLAVLGLARLVAADVMSLIK